ncbi:MAG: hypothetical protein GXX79_19030 [Actinomycetales bacterium]|nr:hypothetical protein [Actinomycetales bacterium]
MKQNPFDPISVEKAMVEAGVLPQPADLESRRLGNNEQMFTEYDPRKYALWRISTVRQYQPCVLTQLTRDDLLFLAGQNPEGHPDSMTRNKVCQNAERARVELNDRATRIAWRRQVIFGISTLILGTVLGTVLSLVVSSVQ